MRGFESRPLSQSWSFESVGVVCLLLSWSRCREICLLCRFSLLIGSNWAFFIYYYEGQVLTEKLLLLFFFLTNFIDISRCADPMRRTPLFFHFEESLSTDNTQWMLSWTLVPIIILCVRQIRRDLFQSYCCIAVIQIEAKT